MKKKRGSQLHRVYTVIKDGEKVEMLYEGICHELGYIPGVEFVKITTRGTISFWLGKPFEIRGLLSDVRSRGFKPSAALARAVERI